MSRISRSSFVYPTNNFGKHNNVHYYFYSSFVDQGSNWSNFGLHQVEIRNESDKVVEVVGWNLKQGRVEEDFKTNSVQPGLFYTARLVPHTYGAYKAIRGAVTFRFKGTNDYFTLAFEDPFHDYVNNGYKGYIEQGNDSERAIASLKDNTPKDFPWGSYEFKSFDGRGKTVFTIGKRKYWSSMMHNQLYPFIYWWWLYESLLEFHFIISKAVENAWPRLLRRKMSSIPIPCSL